MGIKILWQDIFPLVHPQYPELRLIYEALQRAAKAVVRSDTEVTISHVDKYCSVESPCVDLLNRPQMMQKVIAAADAGYDAAVMGCFYDPAVRETRSAVRIPVTAPAESAMQLAQMLGSQFSVIADCKTDIPLIEDLVRLYGFSDRALRHRPVRCAGRNDDVFKIFIDCLNSNDPGPIIRSFEKVARECIEDGSDVVIVGCTYTSAIFDSWGYRVVASTGVPVVSASLAALKCAEMLAELGTANGLRRTTSETSIYVPAQRAVVVESLKALGF